MNSIRELFVFPSWKDSFVRELGKFDLFQVFLSFFFFILYNLLARPKMAFWRAASNKTKKERKAEAHSSTGIILS